MKTATILLTILMTLFGSFILADEIEPSYDSAMVDGNYREWDLSNDFAVEMHKAWRDGSDGKAVKAVLANAYLRYDCDAEQMYVLVLAEKNYPVQVDLRGNDTYVKLNGGKMVSSGDHGDFAWVGVGFDGNKGHAIGWEAKFAVNNGDFDFTIHSEVYEQRAWQTAGSRGHRLVISCDDNGGTDEGDYKDNGDDDGECGGKGDDDGNDDDTNCSSKHRLLIGKIRTGKGSEDGVHFYQNSKEITAFPKKVAKMQAFKITVNAVNSTGRKAYLRGWIDINNDGRLQNSEKILDKKIESTKESKTQQFSFDVEPPRSCSVKPTVALFQIASSRCSGSSSKEGEVETYTVQFVENPVAVTLSSFNATQMADGVKLEWKVEQEINHAGYNVYRSDNEETGYNKINDSIILAWDGFSAFDGTYEYTDNVNGAYFYKLEAVDMDGSSEMFGPYSVQSSTGVADKLDMPESFELKQNYPNPFNPTTTISFSLAERTNVNITIFDLTGRVVSTLVDESMDAGAHHVVWNAVNNFGESLATGVYFYTMRTANFTATKALTIMK